MDHGIRTAKECRQVGGRDVRVRPFDLWDGEGGQASRDAEHRVDAIVVREGLQQAGPHIACSTEDDYAHLRVGAEP